MGARLVIEALVDGKWVDVHNESIKLSMPKEVLKESVATLSRTIQRQVRVRKVVEKVLFTSQKPDMVNAA